MSFIKKNYLFLIIGILLIIILLQRCGTSKPISNVPKVKIDTVWIKHDSLIYSKPRIVKVIKGIKEKKYIPDTSYIKLVKQYNELVDLYTAQNICKDSVKIDSLGYIKITDTVSKNIIKGREYKYNFKYPTVVKTITEPYVSKTQVYIGGGLQGDEYSMINEFSTGVLIKTKSDQIYGIYTGIDTDGKIQYGFQLYWKIKLHK